MLISISLHQFHILRCFYLHRRPFHIFAGGSTLYIESSLTRSLEQSTDGKESTSGGQLHVTGHLGDVMKESAQIAHTVAKTFLSQVDPHNDFLQKAHIHVHVPEVGRKALVHDAELERQCSLLNCTPT